MPDSEAKKAWMKEHTVMIAAKLNKNTDADIFNYYGGKVTAGDIKCALRDYMARHPNKK